MKLNIKKVNNNAILPSYGSDFAAGLDLYSSVDMIVPSNSRKLISTGISISWDGEDSKNYYLRIAPRSGLSVKSSIDIGAGVVDYDYRGELFICFINNGNTNYSIKQGDRIAQAILEKINRFDTICEVDILDETNRGSGGFGSTGI
jgi:dUTP pyrophosphatase